MTDAQYPPETLGGILNRIAVIFAYAGGAVIAAVGLMSAISIIGRSAIGKPIIGDFELVEFGTAIAGTLFLAYCQTSYGHIVVDVFTLRVSNRTREWLDRLGSLLMAVMFFTVGWRTVAGLLDMFRNHETTMLMGVPLWIGYAGMVPGVMLAGVVALAQSLGIAAVSRIADE